MQTAHASVLEYYYQFNLASKQEEQLQELAYITAVTAISTAISMGVSFGIGKVVGLANKYLGSLVNLPDLSGITGIQSVSKVQQFLHGFSTYLMQASVSLSGFSIAIACIKEISQEIFIDPLVETLVSNLVREMGYDATIQMIASTLAESIREEFSGQITSMFKGSQSDFTFQNYIKNRITYEHQYPTGQELVQYFNKYKEALITSRNMKFSSTPKRYFHDFLGVYGTPLKLFILASKTLNLERLSNFLKGTGLVAAYAGLTILSLTIQQFSPFGSIGLGVITIGMTKINPRNEKDIKREKLEDLLEDFFKEFPEDLSKYPSRELIESKFKIKISYKFLEDFLKKKNNFELQKNIYKYFWGAGKTEIRVQLAEILNEQLKNYPNNIENIDSVRTIAKKLYLEKKTSGGTRDNIKNWIGEFLKIKYGPKLAMKIYNEIWASRSNIVNQLKYNDLALYIESKGGRLITTEEEFNKMSAPPTHRIVKIEHDAEDGQIHTFYSRVNNFFYADQWCSQCIQYKVETAVRKFMEEIFGVPFPKTTLKNAYGISKALGGSLEFDGYNAKVVVMGISFTIAFEYDGLQHDKFIKHFHKTIAEFRLRQSRDATKDMRAKDEGTIIIRIKESKGFDRYGLNKIPAEIVKQFEAATGIKLNIRGKLTYDIQSGKVNRYLGKY